MNYIHNIIIKYINLNYYFTMVFEIPQHCEVQMLVTKKTYIYRLDHFLNFILI